MFDPWIGKIPWRRKGHPLQYSGLEKRSQRETTEQLSLSLSTLVKGLVSDKCVCSRGGPSQLPSLEEAPCCGGSPGP